LTAETRHTDWTNAQVVISRANRLFKSGRPFAGNIQPRITMLNNLKTIRNAITHASVESKEKFKTFVRNELTYYPPNMAPGSFLVTLKPGVHPPQTYFTFYAENLRMMVESIIPQ
jgi:hypothetical protein